MGEPTAIGSGDRELVEGDVVGEYVIRDQLGKGGFGTVYRAGHPVIGKLVAIKVLSRRYSSDEGVVSRFVAEARAVNQIRHRNIIDIFSFGQLADGRHYYVMEYLDGLPLDRHLHEQGVLRIDSALPILRAIARALDAAHAKGIAHRDLKPENIVLSFDDEGQIFPKLLDFGIAKLTTPEQDQAHRTGTGVPLGTPYYMSPEQCRGRDVDHRTDIYSFGVLAFRLLTGDYPFHGELIEILHKHMHEDPPLASSVNPALTTEIDMAITWMLQKDPAKRPATVMTAVTALQGDSTAPTPVFPTAVTRKPPFPGRGAVQNADTLPAATDDTMLPISGSRAPLAAGARSQDTLAPARASKLRVWIALGIAVGCGIGALAWMKVRTPEEQPQTVAAPSEPRVAVRPTPTPTPVPVPVPTPTPPPAPATPAHVIITLLGAPEGAEVRIGGKLVGVAPKIQVDFAATESVVVVSLDGWQPKSMTITPNRDQNLRIDLKRKRSGSTGATPNKDDIIHKIPGLEP